MYSLYCPLQTCWSNALFAWFDSSLYQLNPYYYFRDFSNSLGQYGRFVVWSGRAGPRTFDSYQWNVMFTRTQRGDVYAACFGDGVIAQRLPSEGCVACIRIANAMPAWPGAQVSYQSGDISPASQTMFALANAARQNKGLAWTIRSFGKDSSTWCNDATKFQRVTGTPLTCKSKWYYNGMVNWDKSEYLHQERGRRSAVLEAKH